MNKKLAERLEDIATNAIESQTAREQFTLDEDAVHTIREAARALSSEGERERIDTGSTCAVLNRMADDFTLREHLQEHERRALREAAAVLSRPEGEPTDAELYWRGRAMHAERRLSALPERGEREPDGWVPKTNLRQWESGYYGQHCMTRERKHDDDLPVWIGSLPERGERERAIEEHAREVLNLWGEDHIRSREDASVRVWEAFTALERALASPPAGDTCDADGCDNPAEHDVVLEGQTAYRLCADCYNLMPVAPPPAGEEPRVYPDPLDEALNMGDGSYRP